MGFDLPPIDPAQLGVGALVVLGGYVLGKLLEVVLRRYWLWRGRSPSFARVFASLVKGAVVLLAVGAGLTVAFPSVRPVNVLGSLGIASIAAGIAFQEVLGNLFSGVLLLVREPFRAGDQIALGDVRGTVVQVSLRETIVRTFDGRRVIVPNSTAHNGVITVQTGYERVRTSVVVALALDADLDLARATALESMRELTMVADDPAPEALVTKVEDGAVELELRFWSGARQLETLEARDRVITTVVQAFAERGVALPAAVRVLHSSPSFTAALAQATGRPSTTDGATEPGRKDAPPA